MKLRTLEQFEGAIDAEMAWRRRELVTLKLSVQDGRAHQATMMVRAGIALLYAHFEGFIGNGCRTYVDFVRQKSLRYEQLSDPLLGFALKSKVDAMVESHAAHIHRDFASYVRSEMTAKAALNAAHVSTRSNVSSGVLKDLVVKLGLNYAKFELREKLVDESLLRRRNEIAHGEGMEVEVTDYLRLHDDVVQLIDDMRVELLVAARTRTYLASTHN